VLFAPPPPPVWIQRANVPQPIIAWRLADVLGTPVVEGIAIDRDGPDKITVSVIDSRFNPPRIVRQRTLPGTKVERLRAGRRDHLARNEIRVKTEKATYILRVERPFTLRLLKTVPL
jgi:hypothetical protein